MTPDICGAAHPTSRKLFCCFGPNHELPHSAPIRRGCWVTWLVVGIAAAEYDHYRVLGSKSKGRCWYCGCDFLSVKRTRDHVIPRSKRGPDTVNNLVLACQPCNTEKASMDLETYRLRVQQKQRTERVIFYGESIRESVALSCA